MANFFNGFGIGDALGATGGIITSVLNAHNTNVAQRNQYKMLQYQNDFNEKMWNMNNAYNSPSAVMQRYRDAGINPNFVVNGANGGQSYNVTSASAPSVPVTPPTDFSHALAMGRQLSMQQNMNNGQLAYLKDQGKLAVANALKTLAEIPGVKQDNRYKELLADFFDETKDLRVYGIEAQNAALDAQRNMNDAQRKVYNEQVQLFKTQQDKLNNDIVNNNKITDAQVSSMYKHATAALMQANAANRQAIASSLMAQAAWKNAETNALNAEVERQLKGKIMSQIDASIRQMGLQYQFDVATYKSRVKQYEVNLANAILQGDAQRVQNEIMKMTKPAVVFGSYMDAANKGRTFLQENAKFALDIGQSFMDGLLGIPLP